ncbi:MAG: hypothetical protein HQ537_00495 [Parcubacteria group bacterium]|nr:hypothetical protein [Parcubacteria group bacterium]
MFDRKAKIGEFIQVTYVNDKQHCACLWDVDEDNIVIQFDRGKWLTIDRKNIVRVDIEVSGAPYDSSEWRMATLPSKEEIMANKEKVFVPVEEREPNEVDNLKEQITEIQEHCLHDFRLIKEPELKESLIKGVFVGHTFGPTKIGASEEQMALVCIKCSKEKETYIAKTCPRCLGPMREERCLGAGSREKYFGNKYLYHAVKLSRCLKCNFTIGSDEWDQ